MSELQSTIEFSVELFKFYNVDLFQRGMYQVRCSLRASSKLSVEIEVTTPEVTTGLGTAIVLGNYGACRPFKLLYRNEEVTLKDVVLFRCHMLVDGNNLRESLERAEFSLILELWFSDTSPVSMVMVSSRILQLNMSPIEGLHYHLPVLFDYFHLSAVSLTVHAALTALHQPSMKKGLLRYMQSCAPKSSKSWSKIRSAHCTSLTDPVLPVSSNKVYSRINETPQIHLEAYNVLQDSSNNLKSIIKDYKLLLQQREEIVSDNYDTLIVKHDEYDSTKLIKKRPFNQNFGLAELCTENIKLWNYFLLTFSCKIAIQQHLSKKHHNLRVRRFAELFFLVYNPRKTAFGCYDSNYQNYLVIAEVARRSKYMQMLPPLPIHCIALDGESTTMPVIFEDQYQDPFDYKRAPFQNTTTSTYELNPRIHKNSKFDLDGTNCSCGIGKLWETRKSAEKKATDVEFYNIEDPLVFNIPARHSKSLDQLQLRSTKNFHNSLCNIGGYKGTVHMAHAERSQFYSEHNMRKKFVQQNIKYKYDNGIDNICSCSFNQDNLKLVKKSNKNYNDESKNLKNVDICLDLSNGVSEKRYKQFNIKNLSNVKHQYQALVKSLSQTPSDNSHNIFRSTSMQFSPKKGVSTINKFNSLLTRSQHRKSERIANGSTGTTKNQTKLNQTKKLQSKKHLNGKHCEIDSTSSSTESFNLDKHKTGSQSENLYSSSGIRRVRSASSITEESAPLLLSGTESLPNITNIAKLEDRLYPGMTYYTSSTSSSTSEQSGWITSRSSSIASSTDVTNASINVVVNPESTNKRIFSNSVGKKSKDKKDEGLLSSKSNKFYLDSDSCNHGHKHKYQDPECSFIKGCENNQTNISEDFALPPPKQFRDFESPSSSVTNGTNEEDINAVDNLLYHVVDMQTTLERRPSQFNLKSSNETEDFHFKDNGESLTLFLNAKKEFKSQLNFPGLLYSDLNNFASSVPYFHISDEFRIFSPEGLHLVICVHGLDGNSADLRLVKTYLELGLPGAYLDFLMSERNQGDTFSDFDTMTDRLISEILHYLDTSSIRPTRISFVGHSLGNIIIRSALTRPQMKFLLPRLHTFLSLSGPHLGTLYNSSGLVNMGIWFMQKWKKSGSLLQLCLKDSTDPRQSFLYRLSQRSTLHYFKNILLCGSGQDRYVPLHSARIELCKESLKDNTYQGKVYREMVHNILSPIIAEKKLKLVRYDIHHALPNTANALIGRAAHIAVLDSELFIEKFMVVVGIKYFR